MKPLESSDPHELVGIRLPAGEPDVMAECLVEEYLLLGWSDRQVMSLFMRPCFAMTHRIYRDRGHQYVAQLITRIRSKWASEETDSSHA